MESEVSTLWLSIRQGLLQIVGAIEVFLEVQPRTSDLRRELKRKHYEERSEQEESNED